MALNLKQVINHTKLLIAAVILSSFVCQAQAAEYKAKIGHLESNQQSRHIHLVKVAALVKDRTNGAVEFQIFPQAQLGNQRQMTEGVQLGTLEATVSPAAFLGGFNPVVSVLDIPYLLPTDPELTQKILKSAFGQKLLDSFNSKGIKALILWPNGFKNFTSNKPLNNIDDFKGQKFRVMDSKILIEQFKALGAYAIALPFGELYTSLQTGVVDGEENPLDTIQRMKFYEVQKNLVISEHGAMMDVVLFNQAWWNKLPKEYQEIITDAFAEVVPDLLKHKAEAIKNALEIIKKSGTHVRTASMEERAALRKKMYEPAVKVYQKKAGETGKELISLYEKVYNEVSQN